MGSLAEFHFLRPWWLLGFPLLAWAVWRVRAGRGGAGDWTAACDPELLRYLLAQGLRGWLGGAALVAAAGALALVALAGPTWQRLPQPVARDDMALVIVLDLSRSMDVQDLRPSRLERVRYRLLDLLDAHGVGFAALLAYAGRPFLVSPLTDDFATIASQLRVLDTRTMPARGSRADLALAHAGELLQNAGHETGQILLVGDGLSQRAAARARARALAERGYRVSVLGVGTLSGGPVPAAGGFVRDAAGSIVIARLQREALQAVAASGAGAYWELGVNDAGMRFEVVGAARQEAATEERVTDRWLEHGPWLLLPLLLLCAPAFRRGGCLAAAALCCALGLPGSARAFSWSELWQRADQRAEDLFHDGQYAQAAERFREPLWRAAAHYRDREYERALEALEGVDAGAGGWYLRGNALARMGRYEEAEAAYDEVIEAIDAAGDGDARLREDALYNRRQMRQMQEQRRQEQAAGESGQDGEAAGESGESGAASSGGEPGGAEGAEPSAAGEEGSTGSGEAAGMERAEPGGGDGEERQMATAGEQSGDSSAGESVTAGGGQGAEEPPEDSARGQSAGADRESAVVAERPAPGAADEQGEDGADEADGLSVGSEPGEGDVDGDDPAALLRQREARIQAERQRERDQATEAWLRGIRGDTHNYLRRKFSRQYKNMGDKHDSNSEDW